MTDNSLISGSDTVWGILLRFSISLQKIEYKKEIADLDIYFKE